MLKLFDNHFLIKKLAYRYVKLYIRDLKRRVKSILQISEQRASVSNVNKTYTVTGVLVGLGVVGFFAFLFFAVLVGDVVVALF